MLMMFAKFIGRVFTAWRAVRGGYLRPRRRPNIPTRSRTLTDPTCSHCRRLRHCCRRLRNSSPCRPLHHFRHLRNLRRQSTDKRIQNGDGYLKEKKHSFQVWCGGDCEVGKQQARESPGVPYVKCPMNTASRGLSVHSKRLHLSGYVSTGNVRAFSLFSMRSLHEIEILL